MKKRNGYLLLEALISLFILSIIVISFSDTLKNSIFISHKYKSLIYSSIIAQNITNKNRFLSNILDDIEEEKEIMGEKFTLKINSRETPFRGVYIMTSKIYKNNKLLLKNESTISKY